VGQAYTTSFLDAAGHLTPGVRKIGGSSLAVGALLATLAVNKSIVDESSTRTALAELTTTD
jgi:hypothetical protein